MTPNTSPTQRLSAQDIQGRYGAFLERWPWELFGTITTKRPMSEARAEEVWHRFEREIRHRLGHRFEYVRVKEPFEHRPGVHVHFLALDCAGLHRLGMVDWAWYNIGKAHLIPYDPAIGAGRYMTKYVVKRGDELYDIHFSPRAHQFKRPKSARPLSLGAGLVGDSLTGTGSYLRARALVGAQVAQDSGRFGAE